MKTLEKGDILYLRHNTYRVLCRYEVESTTKTHAILKGLKTKVQINGNALGYKVANGNDYYELETQKLKEAYEKQLAVNRLMLAVDEIQRDLYTLCASLPIDTIKQLTQHLNDIINDNK